MWSCDGSEAEGQGNGTINHTFAPANLNFYNKRKRRCGICLAEKRRIKYMWN